ncbi:MAG TPA: DUF1028 domain-containing protein [Candidatus Binatia bacterium]|nr:DUF1028 domain-containing protein [Candidatus Binatia bacterium]
MRVSLRATATAAALVAALAVLGPIAHAQAPRAAPPPPSPSRTDTLALPLRVVLGQGPALAAAAFDSATGSWGAACAASEIAVGARALEASAEAGALLSLGPGAGDLRAAASALARGMDPDSALILLVPAGTDPAARVGIVVGRGGRAAARSGAHLPGFSGTRLGASFACAGYGLRGAATLEAMAEAFAQRSGDLGARLLAALEAGERADGDPFAARGREASAALLVVRAAAEPEPRFGTGSVPGSDRITDLRVDLDKDPIGALGRIYARHAETFLPAAHVRYGDAARRRGDDAAAAREYAAAEAGFRTAVAGGPKDADALNELAWFLATRGGDPAEALRYAEAAVAARSDDPNLFDTLAEAAYRAGNLERAIEAAERAVRLSRGNERYAERLRLFRAAKAALASPSR